MANTVTSANMLLPVPVVGTDPGPDWANNLNACLTLIDQHDHSSGSGVQITPSGLNINADLSMSSNNLTAARSLRLSANVSPIAGATDLGCLYEAGVDLYYNDGSGNQIRITQSGGVAGTPGSISSLSPPASASYVSASSKFVWQSSANTAADMDFRSAILRNASASSNGLTLSPPSAMGSNYTLILPAIPSQTNIMTLDTSGNMSAPFYIDNTTIEISASNLRVKPGSIGSVQIGAGAILGSNIASQTVTRDNLVAVGEQISASCGNYARGSGAGFADITNLAVTITTTGRPVVVGLRANGGTSDSGIVFVGSASGTPTIRLRLTRDVTTLWTQYLTIGASSLHIGIPAAAFLHFDNPAAGTYTYTMSSELSGSVGDYNLDNYEMYAYELK